MPMLKARCPGRCTDAAQGDMQFLFSMTKLCLNNTLNHTAVA
jgi:hypothetical protein